MSGCSLRPDPNPPITRYDVNPEIVLTCKPQPKTQSIHLNLIDDLLTRYQFTIRYVKSDLESGTYLYSQWEQPLSQSIATTLYRAYKIDGKFTHLLYEMNKRPNTVQIDIKVLAFEHRFTDQNHSKGVVIMDATIFDSQNKKILAGRLFRSEVPAISNDAKGGVIALNQALGEIISNLVCWSQKQL
jgi:ABC-type uncharacterized transport system auxiliary subunit